MRFNVHIKLILLAGFAALFAACQFSSPVYKAKLVEQNSPTVAQVESPLPTVVPSLGAANAYKITRRIEESYPQRTEFPLSQTIDSRYTWVRTQDQFGDNAHSVTTMSVTSPPELSVIEAITEEIIGEEYFVDDFWFTYCPTCPASADQAGWGVLNRPTGFEPAINVYKIQSLNGPSIDALVAQSVVIGNEEISGIGTIHYQFTDAQALSEMVQSDGSSNPPLVEIQAAQLDIWLTIPDRLPILYTVQATGRKAMGEGLADLEPFTIQERYSVTEINSNITITVPTEILTAVAPQFKILEGK